MTFKVFFSFFPYIVFAAEIFLFVRRACSTVRARAITTMFLLFCASEFVFLDAFGGNAFAPELPAGVIWTLNFFYLGMMILLPISFLAWICRVKNRRSLWGLAVLAWFLSAVGVWNGLCEPTFDECSLSYPNLPASLEGYRIVHLSDIHASAAVTSWRTKLIVERVNALQADLVCVTGDLVDGPKARHADDIAPLADLIARDGVYYVTGNHEFYFDRDQWRDFYRRRGMTFLANTCVFPHPALAVGGMNDFAAERWREPLPNLGRTFASATNGEFRVLLEHRPSFARWNIRSAHVDLQLSGHTHGGVMPGLDYVVGRKNGGFVKGLYRIESGYLHVSRGTGQWAGFPLRFLNPSTITLITLHREEEAKGK